MNGEQVDTQQKAQRINRDGTRFGAFAEIGAGQEVVRWFFHAGAAAKTVAKSIDAYYMAAGDDFTDPPHATSAGNASNPYWIVSSSREWPGLTPSGGPPRRFLSSPIRSPREPAHRRGPRGKHGSA